MSIGEELRNARLRAGISQLELARDLGVSLRTVGNWEGGQKISASNLFHVRSFIARTNQKHLHYLSGGEPADGPSSSFGLSEASDAELVGELLKRLERSRAATPVQPASAGVSVVELPGRDESTLPANWEELAARRPGRSAVDAQRAAQDSDAEGGDW